MKILFCDMNSFVEGRRIPQNNEGRFDLIQRQSYDSRWSRRTDTYTRDTKAPGKECLSEESAKRMSHDDGKAL